MVGQTISHYRILEKLGEGGMGVVYAAEDTSLDRRVALKFLPLHLAADNQDKQRFIQEAKAASSFDHPNICNVHEIGETKEGQLFIVMTLYNGVPLNEKMELGPLKIEEAVDIAIQIAEGLQAAHDKGIVHRDIKSHNVMVTETGRCVIMDFGLARTSAGANLTRAGATMGTVPYMSPEQALGGETDRRTDIWSLGVVLYEMTSGRLPFRSYYEPAIVYSILNEEPEPVTNFRSDMPAALEGVIAKAMQKDRDRRYQTAGELLGDLRALSKGSGSELKAQVLPRRVRLDRQRMYISGAVLGLAAVVFFASLHVFRATADVIDSIAVLPLDNLTGDPGQEYFVDGMHEAIISELSKISALKVISRTSTLQYKGVKKPPMPQIARELGVSGLVEGSVFREGNQVRISVQLIRGPEDRRLWGEAYERELHSILALHSEVAQAIAGQIRVTITSQERVQLAAVPSVDPKAYEAYLLGRHYWYQRSTHGFDQAIENFRRAVELDSVYTPAYAGLADAYMLLGEQGGMPQEEARTLSGAAIRKALRLDPSSAEVQTALGQWEMHYELNWEAAEEAYLRAIQLSPSDASAYGRYGRFLGFIGRFEEAEMRLSRAMDLDPLSVTIGAYTGQVYLFAGRYDDAHRVLQRTAELNPDHALVRHNLGELYLAQDRFVEAIGELEASVTLSAEISGVSSSHYLAMLGCAYARATRHRDALDVLEELLRRDHEKLVSAFDLASLYTALGEKEEALTRLERGYDQRDIWYTELSAWPWFRPLRDEPRFQAILRLVNLPIAFDPVDGLVADSSTGA